MAGGLNLETELFAASHPVMEAPFARNSNVDGMSNRKSVCDEGSVKHFSANWDSTSVGARPMPTSGLNAVTPGTTQFAICYKGSMCVYDGIPAKTVREIMLIAAAATKSAEMKRGIPFTPLIPTSTPSPQGTSNNLASQQSGCFPVEKSSMCRLQEFPIARRQSLQRFLEKRRIRLGSKAPYASSTRGLVDNMENNFCDDNTPDFASFNDQGRGFSHVLLSLKGN
ncbi:Tify domain [Sesbania bispinosa]|nr:Tify domain [Sesbania bispinosa]